MPKGAPGQPRKPGAGRPEVNPGTVYERSTIRISREAMAWLKRDGISQTIEKLAREKMN